VAALKLTDWREMVGVRLLGFPSVRNTSNTAKSHVCSKLSSQGNEWLETCAGAPMSPVRSDNSLNFRVPDSLGRQIKTLARPLAQPEARGVLRDPPPDVTWTANREPLGAGPM